MMQIPNQILPKKHVLVITTLHTTQGFMHVITFSKRAMQDTKIQ